MSTPFSGPRRLQSTSRDANRPATVRRPEPGAAVSIAKRTTEPSDPDILTAQPGNLRLPECIALALNSPLRQLGYELDGTDVGGGDERVAFHRIKGPKGHAVLLYLDDHRPESKYQSWYFSSLCVRICRASKDDGLGKPAIVLVAPRSSVLTHWRDEADCCETVGLVAHIQFETVGPLDEWREGSADRARRLVNSWTRGLGPDRNASLQVNHRVDGFERSVPSAPVVSVLVGPQAEPYYIFIAAPSDVKAERDRIRQFLEEFNKNAATGWGVEFKPLDWERDSTIGADRAQALITRQVLERYKKRIVLMICLMGSRFGSRTGDYESGTEEEFRWAMSLRATSDWPEIKWFFRDTGYAFLDALPEQEREARKAQLERVLAFRKELERSDRHFVLGFTDDFTKVTNDVWRWLTLPDQPWVVRHRELNASHRNLWSTPDLATSD